MEPITTPPPLFGANSPQQQTVEGGQPDSGATLSSDFETFLKMLTAQMQNQDPLNPVDSTDYATQLATFSSVEQQVLTNDLLRDLGATLGGSTLSELGNWVGMEALVRAPVRFDGAPVTLQPSVALGTDAATLVVRDATGAVVQRMSIDPGTERLIWEGRDDLGALLPPGTYRFEIESYSEDSLIASQLSSVFARVDEARSDNGDIILRLAGGTEIPSTMVTGLRAASS